MKIEAVGVLTGFEFIVPDGQQVDVRFRIVRKDKDDLLAYKLGNLIRKLGTVKITIEYEEDGISA